MISARRSRKRLAFLCFPITLACMALGTAAELGPRSALFAATADGRPRTVTLITGDQITVTAPKRGVAIHRAQGREDVAFSTEYQISNDGTTEHLFVIPQDAVPLIAAGKVDRQLFDITSLVQSRYDDASRDDLPLIITNPRDSIQRFSASDLSVVGATVGAQLASVNGAAVRVPKAQARQLWDSIAAGSGALSNSRRAVAMPSLSNAVGKVWLDRIMSPALDRSVPQVGAPTAWAAGYTGKGVVVAVLDSGVDRSHPDLADRVIDSRNFTDEVDEDIVGHGTHVASIVAGSGAASNGQFRGVAPEARILSGKVCFVFGCPLSAIVEGMQWAVIEKGAKVVNLSLSGTDTPEIDPVEEAINQLTAEYGALFVVAAGNTGTSPVNSPASADGALAVGAIDRNGRVAAFSTRGPRLGDKAIKPEITAPGVQIVAARAANTEAGQPVGDSYVRLSGTSMATPHVAGAAAILLQRFPDWAAGQLKSALMGSARFNPSAGLFDQGAGRLDVAAAINTKVLASSFSFSLGTVLWPHEDDEPVTRTVTYRGVGTGALTLNLRIEMRDPEGDPAPAGMFTVSPAILTIPAGGTATAIVRTNTRVPGGVDGIYTGRLIALDRANGGRVVHAAPVAVDREVESYEIGLVHLDRDGQPATSYASAFTALETRLLPRPGANSAPGAVSVRLPKGRYALDASIVSPSDFSTTLLVAPLFEVTGTETVTIDARAGALVSLSNPVPDSQLFSRAVGWEDATEWGRFIHEFSFGATENIYTANVGRRAKDFTSFITGQWLATRIRTDGTAQPEFYGSTWVQHGAFSTGLTKSVRPQDMAIVHTTYAGARGSFNQALVGAATDVGNRGFYVIPLQTVGVPSTRTEYYTTGPEVGWLNLEIPAVDGIPVAVLRSPITRYPARGHYQSRWNEAPFAPPNNGLDRIAVRTGDMLDIVIPFFADRAGNAAALPGTARLALFRGDRLIGEENENFGLFELPPQPATYRVEASGTQELLELSREVRLAYTFRSARVKDDQSAILPLLSAEIEPPLNAQSEAKAGSVVRVPIRLAQDGSSDPPRVKALTVDVSFDDGASWKRMPVKFEGGQWSVVITHPRQGTFVSLRTVVSDFSGNQLEQTVIRAYALKVPPES